MTQYNFEKYSKTSRDATLQEKNARQKLLRRIRHQRAAVYQKQHTKEQY
jgi:hypothetical protein